MDKNQIRTIASRRECRTGLPPVFLPKAGSVLEAPGSQSTYQGTTEKVRSPSPYILAASETIRPACPSLFDWGMQTCACALNSIESVAGNDETDRSLGGLEVDWKPWA